ncbi:Hypothetical protein NCS54_00749400 [Fusarium falciforme]|uniref:Hypothetical protein n=1 Tax=Fusarium falciforme TaxID=195108 RepID=UPI0022FFC493|nr:Hypothetical protein NCS54_00749400 [Fusarium falciforme]WAO90083.1 Hypothetical protein NCS54_00749400 [Fusarium falciforme]
MPDPPVLQDPAEGQLSLPLLDFGPLPDDLFDVADFDQTEIPDWMELSWTATPVMGTAGTTRGPHATLPYEALRVQDTHGFSPRDHRANATPTNLHVPKERNGGLNEAFTADVHVRDWICQDLVERHVPEHKLEEIPTEKLCQGFLSSYMDCFHGHFPIIHRPTFTSTTTPSPLLLIMCSIGALYRLDRRRAKSLYDITVRSIEQVRYPLRISEGLANLGGDDELVSTAMAENGFYTLVYETIRQSLKDQAADHRTLSWPEWIQHETRKRTLGGIFIVSTLNMIIYNVNPGLHPAEDLDFEAFDDESHWNARTASEWRELRTTWHQPEYLTMREMLMDLVSDDSSRLKNRSRVSPFSAWVITHAFVVYTWHLFQVAPPTSSAILGANVASLLLHSAMQSLARYHELLEESADTNPEELTHTVKPSLISSCRSILPLAYIRLFGSAIHLNRLSLISRDSGSVEASVAVFASTKMIKTPYLLDVVRRPFDGLRRTVKIGHLLMRKTAAFHWSVEHAVAAWDCALFVTKWVHAVELDALSDTLASPAEAQLLESMKQVLDETECSFREGLSLAAALARLWSLSLQDVWVWGITPRMGTILSSLATTYQRINDMNRHRSFAEGGLSH